MRNITTILLLGFLANIFNTGINAQRGNQYYQGARSIGLASHRSLIGREDAIIHNFSQIVESKLTSSILIGSEIKFNLNELSTSFIGIHKKVDNAGHFAVSFSSYGFNKYKDMITSLSYAKSLSRDFSASLSLQLNSISIPEYGSIHIPGFRIGFSGKYNNEISYAILISNIEKIEFARSSELESFLIFGIKRKLSNGLSFFIELEKRISQSLEIKSSIEYLVIKRLTFRIGFNILEGNFGFGCSYQNNRRFSLDFGSQINILLGTIHGLTIKYRPAHISNTITEDIL